MSQPSHFPYEEFRIIQDWIVIMMSKEEFLIEINRFNATKSIDKLISDLTEIRNEIQNEKDPLRLKEIDDLMKLTNEDLSSRYYQ